MQNNNQEVKNHLTIHLNLEFSTEQFRSYIFTIENELFKSDEVQGADRRMDLGMFLESLYNAEFIEP